MSRRPSFATIIWLGLMLLTAISLTIGESALLGRLSAIAIVAISAFKARLVMINYMELDRAPRRWRILYEGWNAVATALIIAGFVLAG